VVVAGLEPAAS